MSIDSFKFLKTIRIRNKRDENNSKKNLIKKKITNTFISLALISFMSILGVSLIYKIGWNILSFVIAG